MDNDLYLRYLGVLNILSECSPFVDEDTREMIETAFSDACQHHPLQYRRVLDRLEIEPHP